MSLIFNECGGSENRRATWTRPAPSGWAVLYDTHDCGCGCVCECGVGGGVSVCVRVCVDGRGGEGGDYPYGKGRGVHARHAAAQGQRRRDLRSGGWAARQGADASGRPLSSHAAKMGRGAGPRASSQGANLPHSDMRRSVELSLPPDAPGVSTIPMTTTVSGLNPRAARSALIFSAPGTVSSDTTMPS